MPLLRGSLAPRSVSYPYTAAKFLADRRSRLHNQSSSVATIRRMSENVSKKGIAIHEDCCIKDEGGAQPELSQ